VVERGVEEAGALAGLRDGTIDWRPGLSPAGVGSLATDDAIDVVRYPEAGFYGLTFNLHPEGEGLFLDRDLRQAVAWCFDPAAAVRAAVGDAGIPIQTEIPGYSWAYPTGLLATYGVDRARATALIEGAGWTLGDDGIYERDGRRLSTAVPVREGAPDRTAWLRSVSDQVRGCGIDLQVAEVPFSAILRMLAVYPHVNAADPDGNAPFDAYFGGLDTGPDPDPYRLYHSAECTSAERPDTFNYGCYGDPSVDRSLEAGRTTTDLATRAQLYGEVAAKVSVDLPIIFAWSGMVQEARRTSLGTTDPAGLPLDTPTWYRPLERLTLVR
jgi:peptide/nickel transport system substrate-binding protein